MLFSANNLALAPNPAVTGVSSTHWQIQDFWPVLARDPVTSVTYDVSLKEVDVFLLGNRKILSVAPSSIITGIPRSISNQCTLSDVIDTFAPFMQSLFGNVTPDLGDDLKKRALLMVGTGMTISEMPFDWTSLTQQGGMGFTVTIPQLQVSGEDIAKFLARQTTPTKLYFEIAPMVQTNGLSWYIRDTSVEMGNFHIDVDAPWWSRGVVALAIGLIFAPFGTFLTSIAEVGGQATRVLGGLKGLGFARLFQLFSKEQLIHASLHHRLESRVPAAATLTRYPAPLWRAAHVGHALPRRQFDDQHQDPERVHDVQEMARHKPLA
jgi:hypothetical protein